jgi:ABC-type glycerol-3-phosphate transport system permease component
VTTTTVPAPRRAPTTAPAGRRRPGRARRLARATTKAPLQAFLAIVGLAWLTPTFGLLVTSFRDPAVTSSTGWWKAVTHWQQWTVAPYHSLVSDPDLGRALLNTVYITLPASILVVLVGAGAAYAFAWMNFRGRDLSFLLVVAMLVVPLQMALIPIATLYGHIGLFGSTWAAVFFHASFGLPFAIFLLRNFFIGIPSELLEAARIDGASEFRIFTRVVLPLGGPAIASLFIFQFLWTWNDLLVALVFVSGSSSPITVFIQSHLRSFGANLDVIAPAAFLSMIVPLVVFFAFQRYFVQGLLAGSVK